MIIPLTKRQAEVLTWIQQGATNKHIAERLGISESSVKSHVSALLKKYAASSRQILAMSSSSGQPVPLLLPTEAKPFGWIHMHGDKVVGIMFTKSKPKDGWQPIYKLTPEPDQNE